MDFMSLAGSVMGGGGHGAGPSSAAADSHAMLDGSNWTVNTGSGSAGGMSWMIALILAGAAVMLWKH
jgi:hypothetical protein